MWNTIKLFWIFVLACFLFCLSSCTARELPYENWTSEKDDEILIVTEIRKGEPTIFDLDGNVLFRFEESRGDSVTEVFDAENHKICTIEGTEATPLCLFHGEIVCWTTVQSYPQETWNLISISPNGNTSRILLSDAEIANKEGYAVTFNDLGKFPARVFRPSVSQTPELYGSFCSRNSITLYGPEYTAVFDLQTEVTTLSEEVYPNTPFIWDTNYPKETSICIQNTETGEERVLTQERMAELSPYAKQALDYTYSRNKGEPTSFFHLAKIIEDKLYLLCTVYQNNFFSDEITLLFQYDFETDELFYLTAQKSYDRTDDGFNVIPIL